MEGLIKSLTFSAGLSCVGTIQISLKLLVQYDKNYKEKFI